MTDTRELQDHGRRFLLQAVDAEHQRVRDRILLDAGMRRASDVRIRWQGVVLRRSREAWQAGNHQRAMNLLRAMGMFRQEVPRGT